MLNLWYVLFILTCSKNSAWQWWLINEDYLERVFAKCLRGSAVRKLQGPRIHVGSRDVCKSPTSSLRGRAGGGRRAAAVCYFSRALNVTVTCWVSLISIRQVCLLILRNVFVAAPALLRLCLVTAENCGEGISPHSLCFTRNTFRRIETWQRGYRINWRREYLGLAQPQLPFT